MLQNIAVYSSKSVSAWFDRKTQGPESSAFYQNLKKAFAKVVKHGMKPLGIQPRRLRQFGRENFENFRRSDFIFEASAAAKTNAAAHQSQCLQKLLSSPIDAALLLCSIWSVAEPEVGPAT
jgi:hypothetical protein